MTGVGRFLSTRLDGAAMRPHDSTGLMTRIALIFGFGLLCLVVLVPSLLVLIQTVFSVQEGAIQLTFGHYIDFFTQIDSYLIVGRTILFSAITTALAGTAGFLFAWLSLRTNVPGGKFMVIAITLPYLIPASFGALSWALLMDPFSGLINQWLSHVLPAGALNIYSFSGMVFVESLCSFPLAFTFFYASLAATDSVLEEASHASGASVWETFRRVTIPRMLPNALSIVVLLFILGLESFDVAWFLGYPADIKMASVEILLLARISDQPDVGAAAIYGLLMLIVVLIFVRLYRRVLMQDRRLIVKKGKLYRHSPFDIGRLRWVASAAFYLLIVLGGALPLLVLLANSLDIPLDSLSRYESPRFYYYQWVFDNDESVQALVNTVLIGLGGATIAIGLGFPMAFLFLKAKQGFRQAIDYLTFLPFVLPASLSGLALLVAFERTAIYGTVWLLLLGFCIKVVPFSIRNVQGVLLQIDHDLELASMTAGGGLLRTVRRIFLPLASPGLLASWLLLFTVFIRQFSLPLLLATSDSPVMSNLVFREWAAGNTGRVAVCGVLVVFVSLPLIAVARWLNRQKSEATTGPKSRY